MWKPNPEVDTNSFLLKTILKIVYLLISDLILYSIWFFKVCSEDSVLNNVTNIKKNQIVINLITSLGLPTYRMINCRQTLWSIGCRYYSRFLRDLPNTHFPIRYLVYITSLAVRYTQFCYLGIKFYFIFNRCTVEKSWKPRLLRVGLQRQLECRQYFFFISNCLLVST